MPSSEDRGNAIASHTWPDWALNTRAIGTKVARRDPVTYEDVRCSACNYTASEVLDFGLPCSTAPTRRGGAFV